MRITIKSALLLPLVLAAARPGNAQDAVGQVCTPWTAGTLDIHHISTGRGNSTLLILPDGTTLLVDAGALSRQSPRYAPPRPDGSRSPGEWISRYLDRVLKSPELDYVFLTHFHDDHMGQISPDSRPSSSGAYKLSGLTEVGERFRIGRVLDRGWPDYQYPAPLKGAAIDNYRAFLDWNIKNRQMKAERFVPGRSDQIVLLRSPRQYPNFEVRNLMANGEVWTGLGTATREHFPPLSAIPKDEAPSENMCSAGIRLSYGKFDYYTGGDIPGIPFEGFPSWHDVETPVAKAVGSVDVGVLNHHGYVDSMNEFFVGALRPRVWLLHVWDSAHPTARVYHRLQSVRLYPGPRDILATNMHEANRQVVVGLDQLASGHGHVLVRVAPGGESYRVIVLDDSNESHNVVKVLGPYPSR